MYFLRNLFISVFIFLISLGVSFANTENKEDNTNKKQESITLQSTINNYILDIYKLQWNKIIIELDTRLEKMNVTRDWKIEVYSNIQETLKLKKKAVEADKSMGKNSKLILKNYLEYMINELENKKKIL